jgi:hypothetical protein
MTMNDEIDVLRKEAMVICFVSLSDGDDGELCCVAALALRQGWKVTTETSK